MEGSQNEEEEKRSEFSGAVKSYKGKSCKGCLYYSSILKSKSRNPFCVGVTRTLQQVFGEASWHQINFGDGICFSVVNVPGYIVGESEMEASKEGRHLTDFKYSCVGYSVFFDNKNPSADPKEKQAELPFCVGIEFLVDKRPVTADHIPASVHTKEDGHLPPKPRQYKPANTMGQEFLGKFTRNASLVASGVARNMQRVGKYVKDNLDDALYPYRRRPK
ncbi:hypothetical protein IFM89_021179 [Coptis chinensis]|uniref:DUF8204 domain-containing protein n=1 Tax=Coptis chinensis TaxID=261450 RepID=A0A835LQZ7_9MAGN|nr:hypothetical protein IFM89_021179 [Coptis chinensis]